MYCMKCARRMTTIDKLKRMILDALDEVREDFDPGEYLEDEEMLDTFINDVKLRINNIFLMLGGRE